MCRNTGLRALRAALALLLCASLSACITVKSYVDPALPVVTQSQFTAPSAPDPVLVLFEFRTKGNANARATEEMRSRVIAAVAQSHQFGQIGGNAPGAGQLRLVIDNVPLTDNAAAKGFGTGLTFGLAGSLVTDGYICTAVYTRAGKTTQTTVKHALHTTVGNKAGPAGLPAKTPAEAANVVVDQLVLNALKQLAAQGAFVDSGA
ncbi:hypothetical protein [Xanthomonas pisi]|uniref:DUF4410 domain-containing protein n=1 Tax=Xanthomonas pisi TaxID=56457 RepID=A0A2S7D797_9XANT|nr:hypothetical protein [Xanthomonas pisi]KLD72472.1 hypothetical protein Y887_00885 [Xanthomonas pisi DSM 18956]PPU69692.1 hypothetical protein XpiCFBP4643_02320 [Xanthomonas pisi]